MSNQDGHIEEEEEEEERKESSFYAHSRLVAPLDRAEGCW
jgi:hypothetical protein